jgi:hypothetical protein
MSMLCGSQSNRRPKTCASKANAGSAHTVQERTQSSCVLQSGSPFHPLHIRPHEGEFCAFLSAKKRASTSQAVGFHISGVLPMAQYFTDEHRKKIRAQNLAKNHILNPPERCEECRLPDCLERHHVDYDKPLEIRWLCRHCHRAMHRKAHGHAKPRGQGIAARRLTGV